jgi:dipeptidyl aminopeptidase/acylaminoacyl peptidase
VLQAQRIRAPLLLAYGERDRRVPIEHGRRLMRALEAAGNEPEWVSYANEGHSWLKADNRIDFARRVEAFLERHLKPEGTKPR